MCEAGNTCFLRTELLDGTADVPYPVLITGEDADDVLTGDVNGDGNVDITDATLIRKNIAEMIEHF